MGKNIAINFFAIGKQYRLGLVGTGLVICLLMHHALSNEDIERVLNCITK